MVNPIHILEDGWNLLDDANNIVQKAVRESRAMTPAEDLRVRELRAEGEGMIMAAQMYLDHIAQK